MTQKQFISAIQNSSEDLTQQQLSDTEIREMFNLSDQDDQMISQHEFKNYMKHIVKAVAFIQEDVVPAPAPTQTPKTQSPAPAAPAPAVGETAKEQPEADSTEGG